MGRRRACITSKRTGGTAIPAARLTTGAFLLRLQNRKAEAELRSRELSRVEIIVPERRWFRKCTGVADTRVGKVGFGEQLKDIEPEISSDRAPKASVGGGEKEKRC